MKGGSRASHRSRNPNVKIECQRTTHRWARGGLCVWDALIQRGLGVGSMRAVNLSGSGHLSVSQRGEDMSQMTLERLPDWTVSWQSLPMSSVLFMKIYTWTRIRSYYGLFSQTDPFDKTCLEIGAGTGYISKLLTEKFHTHTTLIDNNREAYSMFQRVSGEGDYIIADAFSFKPKERFDIVFSDGLIEHFYRKERIKMVLIHRNMAKASGFVIIFVPKKSWFVERIFTMRGGVLELKYDYDQLEAELNEAGLEPIAWAEDWHMIGALARVA